MDETVILITGCSTGIGREFCKILHERGYTVVATARNVESLFSQLMVHIVHQNLQLNH